MRTGPDLVQELERVWRGDEEGEAFHGKALHPALEGVSAPLAGWRPAPSARSIAEILRHVAAWRDFVLAALRGLEPEHPPEDGWEGLPGPDAEAWDALRRRLRTQEDALLGRLRSGGDGPDERDRTLLRFLLHHDLHHGGQVGLLASAGRAAAARGAFLEEALARFRAQKALAEAALERVADEAFFTALGPDENSAALVVKHLAGNLASRWTDFLTTDGEKPDRRRDAEFEREASDTRAGLMEAWEKGWRRLFAAVEPLVEADLARTVTIRGAPLSALGAIVRQLDHYAYHVGQVVFLARHLVGPSWRSLSMPRAGLRPPAGT